MPPDALNADEVLGAISERLVGREVEIGISDRTSGGPAPVLWSAGVLGALTMDAEHLEDGTEQGLACFAIGEAADGGPGLRLRPSEIIGAFWSDDMQALIVSQGAVAIQVRATG